MGSLTSRDYREMQEIHGHEIDDAEMDKVQNVIIAIRLVNLCIIIAFVGVLVKISMD